jgi:hypothetical protein
MGTKWLSLYEPRTTKADVKIKPLELTLLLWRRMDSKALYWWRMDSKVLYWRRMDSKALYWRRMDSKALYWRRMDSKALYWWRMDSKVLYWRRMQNENFLHFKYSTYHNKNSIQCTRHQVNIFYTRTLKVGQSHKAVI